MSKLNVDQKTIKDLFQDKRADFLIPDYQRPYAWGETECQTLWDDIFSFAIPDEGRTEFDSNSEYFLGPIVTFKNSVSKMEVIDGQQRLTTLMLLLRAFYEKFGHMQDKASVATKQNIEKLWKEYYATLSIVSVIASLTFLFLDIPDDKKTCCFIAFAIFLVVVFLFRWYRANNLKKISLKINIMPWTSSDAFAADASTHQGMVYAIQHPFTGEMIYPYSGAHWRYQQDTMLEIMNGWTQYTLKDLQDAEKRAQICGISSDDVKKDVKALVLVEPLEVAQAQAEAVLERGQWPRFYFTQNGRGGIRRKTYINKVVGKLPTNFWPYEEVGHTDEAKKELKNLFDSSAPFDTPKPVRLLDRMLTIATDQDSIVMDFFSGSATTAHAVMRKNAQDGGHRKFILVQLPEKSPSPQYDTLCEIGKERIRRAGDMAKKALEEEGTAVRAMEKFKKEHGTPMGFVYAEWSDSPEVVTAKKKMADDLDIGFRVLKLDETNMEAVYYSAQEYDQQMLQKMESNIKPDRTDLDLLFGCLLEWGLPLSMPYRSEQVEDCTVHTYNDGDLIACFDENIPESVIREIAKRKPLRAVFRDSSFATSPEKINVGEIFKLLAPDTRVKVI